MRAHVDRDLSPAERTLLEWLIDNGIPEAREYRAQIDNVRVVGTCGCVCPTIDLAVIGEVPAVLGSARILSDYIGVTPEGFDVGVLLFAADGKLSSMEIYCFSDWDCKFSLPDIATLRPF